MKKIAFLLLALLGWSIAACAQTGIVPLPMSVTAGKGSFVLSPRTPIVASEALTAPAQLFATQAAAVLGAKPKVTTKTAKRAITLNTDSSLEREEYTLTVSPQGIEIRGGAPQGVFYGLQSLLQLAAADKGRIDAVTIHDKPTMAYRGSMLDVCRHYFPVDQIKRYIDLLAMHKLNRFHWHLTDDQGWRIEIKRYPRLIKEGATRSQTLVGLMQAGQEMVFDGKPYTGYYSQDQVREIVAYAAERYIEVIPEIEMPGHGLGALTAYPELGCTGGPYEVWTRWGVSKDVYCAGKESSFEFVENVLTEVLDLFPSKLIHIGGDECPKDRWKECPACQKRIADEGLKNENELQSYFIHRIEKWMHDRGREVIGWDEIMQGGISQTAIIMVWRDQKYGIDAARKGNKVIMTPKWNCYLDYSQTDDSERHEGVCNRRYLPLRQVYRLDPFDQLRPAEQRNVIGVQANVWTEYMPDMPRVERMVLPRLAALAETGWAYERKQYNDFLTRMKGFTRLYDALGYNYSSFVFNGIE